MRESSDAVRADSERGELTRRALLNAAWAAPVLVTASAAPVVAASGSGVLVAWSSLSVSRRENVTFTITIPEDSAYAGTRVSCGVFAPLAVAGVHTVESSWPRRFSDGGNFQRFDPLVDSVAAGTYAFVVNFSRPLSGDGIVCRGVAWDANDEQIASAEVTVTA